MILLQEVVEIAKEVLVEYGNDKNASRIERLASYILDNLGTALECGYDSPMVNYNYNPPRIDFPEGIGVPTADARTIAAAILRECDTADME